MARLQAVLTALLQHQLGRSLERVEDSLERWRGGELGAFEAHAEVLKHAARAERMAGRIAQASQGDPRPLLRDALDAGLIDQGEFVEMTGVEPDTVAPAGSLDEDAVPQKRDVIRELMERGPVLVHVDARGDDVSVPLRLKRDAKLVLRFGYGLTPAIPDLDISDTALSGTLTFGGVPHHCILPWHAVYAVVSESDQQGMVWPQDVPAIVLQEMSADPSDVSGPVPVRTELSGKSAPKSSQPGKPAKQRTSHLKLVD